MERKYRSPVCMQIWYKNLMLQLMLSCFLRKIYQNQIGNIEITK